MILLKCGQVISRISEQLKTKVQLLDVPEIAPPEAPRAMIRLNDSIFNIGLNRLETVVFPPSHIVNDLQQSLLFAEKRFNQVFSEVFNFINGEWSGVIVNLEYPNPDKKSPLETVEPVFDSLIKIDRSNKELSTFQLKFGYKENPFNKNFTINGYSKKAISIKALNQMPQDIPIENFDEAGIAISIDINNRLAGNQVKIEEEIKSLINETLSINDNLNEYIGLNSYIKTTSNV
jgi:hypothetical protein